MLGHDAFDTKFRAPLVLSQHNAWPVHPGVQVQQTLSELLTPSAARQGRWVLSALHGLRYSLCAVEFQVLPKGMNGKERKGTERNGIRLLDFDLGSIF